MNLGEKILELRKEKHLSQEQLAEKLDVARQTISKWELSETSPNIEQAKQLSKLFNISLDELVGNDIKDSLISKVSNTERLAGLTIKILKGFLIFILTFIILAIVAIILYSPAKSRASGEYEIQCKIKNKTYSYELVYNKNNKVISGSGDEYISEIIDNKNSTDIETVASYISEYFTSRDIPFTVTQSEY